MQFEIHRAINPFGLCEAVSSLCIHGEDASKSRRIGADIAAASVPGAVTRFTAFSADVSYLAQTQLPIPVIVNQWIAGKAVSADSRHRAATVLVKQPKRSPQLHERSLPRVLPRLSGQMRPRHLSIFDV